MVRVFAPMLKRDDLSTDEYNRHWHSTHAELAKNLPTLLGYHQSHVLAPDVPGLPRAPYDGIAEDWFEDFDAAIGLQDDPDYLRYLRPDEPRFVTGFEWVVAVEEEIEGPLRRGEGAKALLFLKRAADLSASDLQQEMKARASALKGEMIGAEAFAQSLAHPKMYDGGEEPFADAVVELWWSGLEAYEATGEEAMERWLQEFGPLLEPAACSALTIEERVVIPAPRP